MGINRRNIELITDLGINYTQCSKPFILIRSALSFIFKWLRTDRYMVSAENTNGIRFETQK